jgi:hypothetical protein
MTILSRTLMLLTAAGIAAAPAWRVETVGAAAAPAVERRVQRDVTIPAGTRLRLTLDQTVASNSARVEDRVRAHLAAPVVVNGRTVLPADSEVIGHVVSARQSGKVKGRAYLAMRFSELRMARDDDRYDIRTATWAREAQATKKKDAVTIAAPGAVGAVVGGLVDGKKGAAIGAGVGAGAGTGVVLSTRGKEVTLPRGSTLIVRLSAPLTVRI